MSVQAITKLEAVHQYGRYTNLTASALIESGQGTLQGVVVNSHTSGTLKFWDSLTAANSVIFDTITLAAGERWIPLFGAKFTAGCFLTIGGTANVTLIWN